MVGVEFERSKYVFEQWNIIAWYWLYGIDKKNHFELKINGKHRK